jgi:hypothetical protein
MKMYIIVRDDIHKSYQAAQGGHALAQMALDWPEKFQEWNNQTIVYLKTSYEDLQRIASSGVLNELGCVFSDFYEPDIGGQLTAISIYGPSAGNYLKDYRLL